MSHSTAGIETGVSAFDSLSPVYFFDLIEDRPEIGGVAAVSLRFRRALGALFGPRLVPVHDIAGSLGCGEPGERSLTRERRASRATCDNLIALLGTPAEGVVIPAPLGAVSDGGFIAPSRGSPYLLAVQHGSHHPQKTIDGLLRVFAGLSERLPGLALVVVGGDDGGVREACADRPTAIRSRIDHRGLVSRNAFTALHRGAEAFVMLSRFEGFNLPAAEAACCSTPLSLADLPVDRELQSGAACFLDLRSRDFDEAARDLSDQAEGLRGYVWAHAASCSAEAVALKHAELVAELNSAAPACSSPWIAPTTRVLRVGPRRRHRPMPHPAVISPRRAALRRRRLARVFLAGTMLGGSATLGSMIEASPGLAATACGTAVNASGGAGGASSDGTTNGGAGGSTSSLPGGSGAPSSAGYYGGGGGGAGGDCTTPAGGAGGASDNTAGGASGATGATGATAPSASSNDYFSGGGGGGGGSYGGTITGISPGGFTGGAGQTGGAGGGQVGNTGGGGGGGGGLGTALLSGTVELHGPSQGGDGGGGGTATNGAGGHGGDGGIGTAVFNRSFLIIAPGISTTGGTGGAGGDIAPGGAGTVGTGGAGGIGLLFSTGGSVTSNGTIAGGNGGTGGSVGTGQQGQGGLGGAGVVGADIRVVSSGAISGGLSGDGLVQANAITFTGGLNTLSLENGSSLTGDIAVTGSLDIEQNVDATITNTPGLGTTAITGSGSLIKTGAGTLILSGSNSYSGGTTIDAGVLQVGAIPGTLTSMSLGSGSILLDGGTLQAAAQNGSNIGFVLGNPIQIGSSGGAVSVNGNAFVLSGNITDDPAGAGALSVTNTNTNGINTLTLSGANSFTGGLIIGDHTVVQLGATNAAGRGSVEIDGSGGLDLGHFDQTVTLLTGSGNIYNIGNLTANVSNTLTVASGVFTGNIIDGGNGTYRGQVALTKISDGSASGGTLTISGAFDQYDGPTNVSAGVLRAASTTGFSPYSDVTLASAGTLDLNGFSNTIRTLSGGGLVTNTGAAGAILTIGNAYIAGSTIFGGAIADGNAPLGLTKIGPQTLTLTGANTYTGATTISTGTLQAGSTTGLTPYSAYAVGSGATLDLGGFSNAVRALTGTGLVTNSGSRLASLSVGLANDTSSEFDGTLVDGAAPFGLTKVGAGTLTLTGTNTYTGGTTIGGGTLQIGAGGTTGSIVGNVTDNALLVFARSDTPTYGGVISGVGGILQAGPGTLVLTGADVYTGGTTVTAGTLQIGDGGTTGSIAGDVTDNAVLAFARSDTVTYGGVVSGPGALSQAGPGTLVLTGADTYTGGTTIALGTLQIGAGGTTGSIFGDVADKATLAFAHGDTLTYGGVISGSGGLDQIGSGTLNLTGASTYAGATTVQAGRLAVNGSLGNTAVAVASGATLGGSGTIAGDVTIADGGILAPGNSPGIITVGSLTLTPGANGSTGSLLDYELGTIAAGNGPTSDLTNVTRNLTLVGTLNVTDAGGFTSGSYRIFNYGGALTNDGLAIGTYPAGYTGVVQTIIPNQINLVVALPTAPVQFWDGALLAGNGTIAGGTGVWTNNLTNWTDANGTNNAAWSRRGDLRGRGRHRDGGRCHRLPGPAVYDRRLSCYGRCRRRPSPDRSGLRPCCVGRHHDDRRAARRHRRPREAQQRHPGPHGHRHVHGRNHRQRGDAAARQRRHDGVRHRQHHRQRRARPRSRRCRDLRRRPLGVGHADPGRRRAADADGRQYLDGRHHHQRRHDAGAGRRGQSRGVDPLQRGNLRHLADQRRVAPLAQWDRGGHARRPDPDADGGRGDVWRRTRRGGAASAPGRNRGSHGNEHLYRRHHDRRGHAADRRWRNRWFDRRKRGR